jgi:hypothetical protein
MAARKNKTPAQIINYLRKAEVELAGGRTVREVCKELGVNSSPRLTAAAGPQLGILLSVPPQRLRVTNPASVPSHLFKRVGQGLVCGGSASCFGLRPDR